jgi:hypothetical protein
MFNSICRTRSSRKIRDVHQDVSIAHIMGNPAPPFHVQLDLPDPLLDGDVERGEGIPPDDAVIFESVPSLEPSGRCFQHFIEQRRVFRNREVQVSGDRETFPEKIDTFAPVPFFQFGSGRDSRPPPGTGQVPVMHQSIL